MPFREISTDAFRRWTPGIAGIRTSILESRVVRAVVPGGGGLWPPDKATADAEDDIEVIAQLAIEAVRFGRVVHLGHLPNEAIIAAGDRGGPLYSQGGLPPPFEHPWVFVHTWNQAGDSHETTAYLVNPLRLATGDDGGYEIVELQPGAGEYGHALMVGDRGLLHSPEQQDAQTKYRCQIMPSPFRYLPDYGDMNNGRSPESAAAGNLFDPLMAALLLLNTDGVSRSTVTASEKLAKARAKSGKPPIPPHDVIDSGPYITALLARSAGQKAGPGGGHHASPIAHIRRGHFRTYATGQRTFIRETLVNVTGDARASFVSKRSHYAAAPTENPDGS